ncbi:MAG: site-2 protease family protein [Verrucomicrobia bacterium]|nr:site-2 protease family protein [Verrucomicrobiota bacterium]
MSSQAIINGLLSYLCLLVVLTFHEFAHAWVAWKCGDDTAKEQGRVSLNPVVHMDLLGTVILPLLVVFLSAADSKVAGFIIGWGKPVPVDPRNLRNPRLQDTLISLAGPAMNVLLALALMVVARGFVAAGLDRLVEVPVTMALISLLLCFFNLLPIPPLDGSHVVKNLFDVSDELYYRLARFGFIIVILAIQLPLVRGLLHFATAGTFYGLQTLVGLD